MNTHVLASFRVERGVDGAMKSDDANGWYVTSVKCSCRASELVSQGSPPTNTWITEGTKGVTEDSRGVYKPKMYCSESEKSTILTMAHACTRKSDTFVYVVSTNSVGVDTFSARPAVPSSGSIGSIIILKQFKRFWVLIATLPDF